MVSRSLAARIESIMVVKDASTSGGTISTSFQLVVLALPRGRRRGGKGGNGRERQGKRKGGGEGKGRVQRTRHIEGGLICQIE